MNNILAISGSILIIITAASLFNVPFLISLWILLRKMDKKTKFKIIATFGLFSIGIKAVGCWIILLLAQNYIDHTQIAAIVSYIYNNLAYLLMLGFLVEILTTIKSKRSEERRVGKECR